MRVNKGKSDESERHHQKIEADGWYLARQKGSHRQYKHKSKKGLVTIAAHKLSDEVAPGTLNSILKQAQIKEA